MKKRKNYFSECDGDVDSMFSAKLSDYKGLMKRYGINRGHLAPASNFKYNKQAYQRAFCLWNIFPQNAESNAGLWLCAERLAQHLVDKAGIKTVYVYSGTRFKVHTDAEGNKFKHFELIGSTGIAVPDVAYKIYVAPHDGMTYTFAVMMDNSKNGARDTDLLKYETTVEIIEERTGFKFPDAMKGDNVQPLCDSFSCDIKHWSKKNSVCQSEDKSDDSDESDDTGSW